MRLHEREDFRALLTQVADRRGFSEYWIEKDYYLTEALRRASHLGTRAILKGGTSLSKAWSLVVRISEDIDLVLDRGEPPGSALTGKEVNNQLRSVAADVGAFAAFHWDPNKPEKEVGGKARSDYFAYDSVFPAEAAPLRTAVLLEAGIRSANWPTEVRPIVSYLGEDLTDAGQRTLASDVDGFEMRALDYRRTFVEKMFAIHALVERHREGKSRLGRGARHYADLYYLAGDVLVQKLVGTEEYGAMYDDQLAVGKEFFDVGFVSPPAAGFADSAALFPETKLRGDLRQEYERDVRPLFGSRGFPSFDDVLRRFEQLRQKLQNPMS